MQKKYRDRLLKLATHLKEGKLGHKKFDFTWLNHDPKKSEQGLTYECGTLGCALGECPIVFPRQWKFDDTEGCEPNPILRKDTNSGDSFWDAEHFFGLNDNESGHLFAPGCQTVSKYGGKHLGNKATKIQVANNILAFLKIKE